MSKTLQKSFPEKGNSFTKKVGATTYIVNAYFPDKCKESFNDKLLRIIKNDAANNATAC